MYVYLLSGPGKGQISWVASNTIQVLAIDNSLAPDQPQPPNWTTAPDTDTAFALAKLPPDGEFIRWNFLGPVRDWRARCRWRQPRHGPL